MTASEQSLLKSFTHACLFGYLMAFSGVNGGFADFDETGQNAHHFTCQGDGGRLAKVYNYNRLGVEELLSFSRESREDLKRAYGDDFMHFGLIVEQGEYAAALEVGRPGHSLISGESYLEALSFEAQSYCDQGTLAVESIDVEASVREFARMLYD